MQIGQETLERLKMSERYLQELILEADIGTDRLLVQA